MADPLHLALAAAPSISRAAAARLLTECPALGDRHQSPWLLAHQRPAVARLLSLLERWSGALLADATGLGKTYTALGVVRALGVPACAVVPAVLREQWHATAARLDTPIQLWSHELLSRGRLPATTPELVVVDEAHHFRNPATRRYGLLARWLTGRRVLLITATPIVNEVADLVHLVHLYLPDDGLRCAGMASLDTLRSRPDQARRAMSLLAVARTSSQAAARARWPRRLLHSPVARPTATPARLRGIARVVDSLETPGPDQPRALLTLLLYRAMASSVPAFRATVRRQLRYVERAIEAAEHGWALPRREFTRVLAGSDPDQLWLLPLVLDRAEWKVDVEALRRDQDRLTQLEQLATAGGDPKADLLAQVLGERDPGARALVFVNAIETARYLTRRLPGAVAVTGGGGWTPAGPIPARDALRPFRPNPGPLPRSLDARVLIATDVAGEGLDLQAADLVVHYDLPWTPARLAQRLGRARRLGSPHRRVSERAFLPDRLLATRIRAVEILIAKERAGSAANRVLAAPLGAVIGLNQHWPRHDMSAQRPGLVYRLHAAGYLATGAIRAGLPRGSVVRCLRRLLRAAGARVPAPRAVRLARALVLRTAARGARERDQALLERCDRTLVRLASGLRAGELLLLEDALAERHGRLTRVFAWLDQVGDRPVAPPRLELLVVEHPP